MGQAQDREAPGVALFLDHEQQGGALAVGPLHEKGNIDGSSSHGTSALRHNDMK
jgi:hypothetical protein